jgi:hypothetical protein
MYFEVLLLILTDMQSGWKSVFIIVFLFFQYSAYGQWLFEKIRQAPSPDASSLGSYINFPVANNAGLIPIDIPLSELSTDIVKIPVNLSYHGAGVKVEDEASSVGMNWSLNVSGAIIRSVRGTADDINPKVYIDAGQRYRVYWGWLNHGKKLPVGFPASHWASIYANTDARKEGYAIAYMDPATSDDVPDTEPDIYYINAGSIKAKFIFDNDGNLRFLTENDYKITYTRKGSDPSYICNSDQCGIDKFVVTDDFGNQYIFDQIEMTTTETEESTMYNFKQSTVFTVKCNLASAWYLSKIVSVNGREINYTYKDVTIQQSCPIMQMRSACVEGNCSPSSGNTISSKTKVAGKIIESASDSFLKLEFSSSSREDLNGAVKIDNVKITSGVTGDVLKQYELSYFYSSPSIGLTSEPYKNKRLFFEQLHEVDKTESRITYKLSYDRPNLLPPKNSSEQDFFGYYNANRAHDLIPTIYVYPALGSADRYRVYPLSNYPGSQIELYGWDRSVDPAYVTAGALKQIEFPTGGKVNYTFQSNEFYEEGVGMHKGGGLRIAEVEYLDHDDRSLVKKQYDYSSIDGRSSGVLIEMPKFAREMTYGPNPLKSQNGQPAVIAPNEGFTAYLYLLRSWNGSIYFNAETDLSEYDFWNIFTQRFSISRTRLSDLDGQPVSYTTVSILESNNGKTVYEYYPPRSYKTHATFVKTAGSVNAGTTIVETTGGDEFPYTPSCSDDGLVFGKIEKTGYNIFPYPPLSMDQVFTYGKINHKTVYDVLGNIKQQHTYKYNTHSKNGSPVPIRALTFGMQEAFCEEYRMIRTGLIPRAWSIYTYYADADALLEEEIVSSFELGSELVTTDKYSYVTGYTKPKHIESEASDGSQKITEFTYPVDYGIQSNWSNSDNSMNDEISVMREMANRNIYTPIESITSIIRNGESKVVGASSISYTMLNDKLLPWKKKYLESSALISDFEKSYISGDPSNCKLNFDTRYLLDHQVDKYDAHYYPAQETDRTQTYAYLYGYNGQLLTAFVTNATANQIYYTSFESLTTGFSWDCKTGQKSAVNGFDRILTGLTPGNYKLSYWKGQGDSWQLIIEDVVVTSDTYRITLNGTMKIDELRFYPANAQMITYTYNPGVGVTSVSDQNCISIYYEYDSFNRLSIERDQNRKILKQYKYNYRD